MTSATKIIFMLIKYSPGLQAPSVICFGCVLFISRVLCTTATCLPPDFPEGGSYTPEKSEYEVASRVRYSCNEGLKMFGFEERTCLINGKWSGNLPFCESPVKMKNPTASFREDNYRESNLIDGSPTTCFRTKVTTDAKVRVYLDRPAVIHSVRIYVPKSSSNSFKIVLHQISIKVLRSRVAPSAVVCHTYDREITDGEWVTFTCEDNARINQTDYITVELQSGTAKSLHLCEIEAYSKDDDWCDHSPENFVPNSRLEVSRNKADLRCKDGFKEKNGKNVYATCASNKWTRLTLECVEILCDSVVNNKTLSEGGWDIVSQTSKLSVGTGLYLKCKPGYQPKGEPQRLECLQTGNWTKTSAFCKEGQKTEIIAISVGVVIAIIIFIMLGLTIYLIQKKKGREVVVIYKPGENNSYSTPPSIGGHSIGALSEAEYSTVYYEAVQSPQQVPKIPTAIPPRLVPRLERGYSKPVDDRPYANTANTLPTDLAFGTLPLTKSSSLYNSLS